MQVPRDHGVDAKSSKEFHLEYNIIYLPEAQ